MRNRGATNKKHTAAGQQGSPGDCLSTWLADGFDAIDGKLVAGQWEPEPPGNANLTDRDASNPERRWIPARHTSSMRQRVGQSPCLVRPSRRTGLHDALAFTMHWASRRTGHRPILSDWIHSLARRARISLLEMRKMHSRRNSKTGDSR